MTEERKQMLKALPGYVVFIRKPEDFDKLYGPIENSFSLDVVPNRTRFFWTGNSGSVDGLKDAEHEVEFWRAKHPDWHFKIYDARDVEALPVVLNWDVWLDAHEWSTETLAGIKNKFEARNLRFTLKGKPEDKTSEAVPLKMRISTFSLKNELVK